MKNKDGEPISYGIASDELDPEEVVIKTQKASQMRGVVDQLEPRYKRLVELRYFEELSYDEISDILELPLGTVKAQLFRAREALAKLLEKSKDKI